MHCHILHNTARAADDHNLTIIPDQLNVNAIKDNQQAQSSDRQNTQTCNQTKGDAALGTDLRCHLRLLVGLCVQPAQGLQVT